MTIRRIIHRRGTAAQWAAANPVLRSGETGYVEGVGRKKTGDGVSTWAELAYDSMTPEEIAADSALTSTYVPIGKFVFADTRPANPALGTVRIGAVLPVNLLTVNMASAETDTTGWNQQTGTLTRSTAAAKHGLASLSISAPGASPVSARTDIVAVTPGLTYTALASARAATTPRNAYVNLQFFQANGTSGTTTGQNVSSTPTADSTSAWLDMGATAVAPPDAAFVRVGVGIANATQPAVDEVHYFDCIGLYAGTVATWNLS